MPIIVLWIWLCAYLNCVGWTLSALHQLNAGGYGIAFAMGLGAVLFWQRKAGRPVFQKPYWPKYLRRFRRPFPLAFLVLATLALLGGALHQPANYDALAYRTPRVLHWLAAGQWEWIHTDFARLNTRTAGFEWLTAPQFLFWHTDRLVFLLNVISFLLLPGRVFAVLTRLGVRPQAAWYWMWLFPSGYGYVLQAGSVVNDMFGAVMALTAIEFALRAAREKKVALLWTSGLAVALMTSGKAFNIVLLAPWLAAAWPALFLLLRRPAASVAVVVLAASASIAPTALINLKQCGDWTGLRAEQATIGGGGKSLRFLANTVNLTLDNLVPPFFPFVKQWDHLVQRLTPPELLAQMNGHMEKGLMVVRLPEMQVEESAGLGAGLTILLLMVLAKKIRAGEAWPQRQATKMWLVPIASWLALGIFMMQVGSGGPARYLLPFYVLLATPILWGKTAGEFFRIRFWRSAALAALAAVIMLLILNPARPLWPAITILRSLDAQHSPYQFLNRAWNVYATYGSRGDGFATVIAQLPPDANPLGYLALDEPETGLWRPFGQRRILHVRYDETPASIHERGLKYALVSEELLAQHQAMQPSEWLRRMDAETIQAFDLKMLAGSPSRHWLLLRFN